MKRIGLFGGTFDPIHNGHIRIAMEAVDGLGLDEVRVMPLNQPNHRSKPIASVGMRSEMILSAIKNPLILEDAELVRGGTSYTVETLNYLREKHTDYSFLLILGEDAFMSLETWHKAEEIFSLTNIVVVSRDWQGKEEKKNPHSGLGGTISRQISDLVDSVGYVYFMKTPLLQISSSDIREKRKLNRSISGLVPTTVENIILENNLYL